MDLLSDNSLFKISCKYYLSEYVLLIKNKHIIIGINLYANALWAIPCFIYCLKNNINGIELILQNDMYLMIDKDNISFHILNYTHMKFPLYDYRHIFIKGLDNDLYPLINDHKNVLNMGNLYGVVFSRSIINLPIYVDFIIICDINEHNYNCFNELLITNSISEIATANGKYLIKNDKLIHQSNKNNYEDSMGIPIATAVMSFSRILN